MLRSRFEPRRNDRIVACLTQRRCNHAIQMVPGAGLEPATTGLSIRRVYQLRHPGGCVCSERGSNPQLPVFKTGASTACAIRAWIALSLRKQTQEWRRNTRFVFTHTIVPSSHHRNHACFSAHRHGSCRACDRVVPRVGRTHNHRLLRPARLPVAPPGLRQRKTPCGRAEGVSGNRAKTAAISRCNPPALREAGQAGCIGCCDECSLGADSVRRFIRCQAVFRIPARATQVHNGMILQPVTRTTTVRPSAPALRPILAP